MNEWYFLNHDCKKTGRRVKEILVTISTYFIHVNLRGLRDLI
jgi:hypothetical protein